MTVLSTRTALSVQMREGSRSAHADAESSHFMAALAEGRINAVGYRDYLTKLRPIYAALEQVALELSADPIAGELIDPALFRLSRLEADVEFWAGSDPANSDTHAVTDYVDRILATATDPARYIAHHYTRYLGDLSGGQAIGRILQRSFGLQGFAGTQFYCFDAIPKPKLYKDAYRAKLDALPLSATDQSRVVAEVRRAFDLNRAIFTELGTRLPDYLRE